MKRSGRKLIKCRTARTGRHGRASTTPVVKALARAFRWRKMLDDGEHATLEDLARAKDVHATYVSRVLRLTLLSPEIVEAILDGQQPGETGLDDLLAAFPLDWAGQCSHFRWRPTAVVRASYERRPLRAPLQSFPVQFLYNQRNPRAVIR
jgi:hypothetical protein